MGWCLPLNGLLSATQIMMYICRALVVLLTIPFHESAHALVSHWLGDDTAVRAGRLSLNPMRHFDPLGALCMLVGGVGWAKPVSINPYNYKNPKVGMAVSAAAGPISNLLLAWVSMILYKICYYSGAGDAVPFIEMFFYYMITMNLSLAVFNLIPVPPFDGSRIFLLFLPEVLTFKIEDFEGPLDLLLYLVGKNKMNLYDINIMELIDQYTATIRNLQDNRMEVASEFIDMAAHLVQMKSALLLPRSPEAERMKAELTGRLIEYSACKEVAAKLGSRARDLYTAVRQPMPLVGAAEYTRRHDPNLLVTAWFNLMGRNLRKRKPTQERFEPLVTAPFVSVSSRVSHMLRGLLKGTLQKMNQLFNPEDSRSTHVATFLALLELIRAGRIKVEDEGQLNLDRTHRRNKEASAHE